MNREIKFRAWIKKIEDDDEHPTGLYMSEVAMINYEKKYVEVYKNGLGYGGAYFAMFYRDLRYDRYKFEEIEIMQYTGLKLNGNNELYEDDLLKLDEGVGRIVFYDGCIYVTLGSAKKFLLVDVIHYKNAEYLGNIYEQAELI